MVQIGQIAWIVVRFLNLLERLKMWHSQIFPIQESHNETIWQHFPMIMIIITIMLMKDEYIWLTSLDAVYWYMQYVHCALVRSFRPGLALPCPAMPHDKITSPSIPDFLHLRTGEGDLRICCKQQKYGKIIKDDLILNGRGSIKFLHNREAGQITFLWNHQSQTLIVWEKLKSNWLNFTRRALATRWKKKS